MGVDLHIIPSGFRNWSEAEWDAYFNRYPESVRLGKAGYVGRFTEAVMTMLENNQAGSRFPLLMRMHADEIVGWQPAEVPALLRELQSVRDELAKVAITLQTLRVENEADLQEQLSIFRKYYPQHPLGTLADFFFKFFDDFAALADTAIQCRMGLFVSY